MAKAKEKHVPMTVADLIAILGELDQKRAVIMSKDSEGNDFRPMDRSVSSEGFFNVEDSEFYTPDPEDSRDGTGDVPAICLWPGYWPRS